MKKGFGYLIGVDIGGTKTSIVVGSLKGEILKKVKFPTPFSYKDTIAHSFLIINDYIEEFNNIYSIGISCGGPLNSKKGIIISPPNLPSFVNVEIVNEFEKRFNIPTFLDNDANACALAEWKWGNGKNFHNLIFLTFGTGLGAGLILNNKIYSGSNGNAGEVGHIRLNDNGPYCYRKNGSFESFCSGSGISKLYKMKYNDTLSTKEICQRADDGNNKALKIIEESAINLGKGLSILVDLLNPDCIIIGSIYSRSENLFRDKMYEVLKREALKESLNDLKILPSGLKEQLGDMAALGVALNGVE
ncbi:MAG: ROK family protein [Peptostreptococcaceae bacterium]|nr:ROK family protein [Peptostreptococcaceae bacterium]